MDGPVRGKNTKIHALVNREGIFLSTLPARGAIVIRPSLFCRSLEKSISNVLGDRAYGAKKIRLYLTGRAPISPRSPRGERHGNCANAPECNRFLSTLPARGATTRMIRSPFWHYFYPRSPRGERFCPPFRKGLADFYPRSPRGERQPFVDAKTAEFLSTLPAGERPTEITLIVSRISIHAPREGSDCPAIAYMTQRISIHAPREGSDS